MPAERERSLASGSQPQAEERNGGRRSPTLVRRERSSARSSALRSVPMSAMEHVSSTAEMKSLSSRSEALKASVGFVSLHPSTLSSLNVLRGGSGAQWPVGEELHDLGPAATDSSPSRWCPPSWHLEPPTAATCGDGDKGDDTKEGIPPAITTINSATRGASGRRSKVMQILLSRAPCAPLSAAATASSSVVSCRPSRTPPLPSPVRCHAPLLSHRRLHAAEFPWCLERGTGSEMKRREMRREEEE